MMNRHSKGSQGPPPQSYHQNGNGNGNENSHGYGPGNGIHGPNPNQYHNGYPAHHPGHDQQFHETPAVSPAPVALQQAQEPLTHFQKCIPRTRTIAHYKRIEQIGEGTYGQVYKATCLSSNRTVALKKIRLTSVATEGLPRTVIREIKILKALQHENMVRMLEVVSSKGCEYLDEEDEHKEDKKRRLLKDEANNTKGEKDSSHKEKKNNNNDTVTEREKYEGNLFLVLEYISHDLSGILDMGIRFNPVQSKYIFQQLLSVLDYMHEKRYVHRDLKSSNILVDQRYRVKLADFGLARSIDDEFDWQNDKRKERLLTNKVVTIWYRSPELLLGAVHYDEKVDIWSAGCILAELLLGKALFPGTNDLEQLRLIFKMMGTPSEDNWEGLKSYPKVKSKDVKIGAEVRAEFRDKYGADERFVSSPSSVALIERLLELDPKKRWRAKQALDSQYFRSKPTIPANRDVLGTIPITGDSHEFQTKPIRKQAKIVAQKASASAKKKGENEKEAYEKAYKEYLAKAAETGTFEVIKEDDTSKNTDRDKDKDRHRERDYDKDRIREKDRESDREKKRRRREREDTRETRDRENERDRREKDEERDKRHKREKDSGDDSKKDRQRKESEWDESNNRRDRRIEKDRDKSKRDREKDPEKRQQDRENSDERKNDTVQSDSKEKSGERGKRSDERKETRPVGNVEDQSEERKPKRGSRSRSRDRYDKDGKRNRRDNRESSRERRERRDRDRSRDRKEKRDRDRGRQRDRDRRDKDDDRKGRDKDRKERDGDSRKDKDRRDKEDKYRSGRDKPRSRSRERSRRNRDGHDHGRNRDRTQRHDEERRRNDWERQGRGHDNRDNGFRDQYPPRNGPPPGWDSRDGPRYNDRPYRR